MKRYSLLLCYSVLLVFGIIVPCSCFPHPGVGIVKDSKNNIYYTDLKYIWKITPDGKKTAVVSNVHTHELYMDPADNLYGEHLWYNGERLNTWGHYIWCLKNNGELVKIQEPMEGFLTNYSFVRDTSGNMYWVERFTVSRFMKKTPDGKISVMAEGKFNFISWLHCTGNGTIYFTESNKLHKLSPDGEFTLLANDLMSKTTAFSMTGRDYDSYGIWSDNSGNIYMAMIAAKKVNRISPDGKVETIFFSNTLWTPCSGIIDNDGNLWLMEFSVTNETRVRKINNEKLNNPVAPSNAGQAHLLLTIMTGAAIAILLFLYRLAVTRHKWKLGHQLI